MSELTHRDAFLESLERCTSVDGFISAFYKRFLASSEEVRLKFRFTDFEKQEEMLLGSLRLSAGSTVGDTQSLRELRERAESHDRYHLNIAPSLYAYWLDAIIETAAAHDEQWDDDVEEAWQTILGYVISHMSKYY